MIETIIEEKLKEIFFPFESEVALQEQFETLLGNSVSNYKMYKHSEHKGWKSVLFVERYVNTANFIKGLLFVYNEAERKLMIGYQIGELRFPRIRTIHFNTEPNREANECLDFLYGNGQNLIYLYTLSTEKPKKEEQFERIRKNPLFWYLHKSLRKAIRPVRNQWVNFEKSKVLLSSLGDFYLNLYARDRDISDMKPADYMSLHKSVIKKILYELRKPMTLTKMTKQRSVFIGFYLYPLLMNKVSYDKDIWFNFLEEIKYSFREEAMDIINNAKLDLENNRLPEDYKIFGTEDKSKLFGEYLWLEYLVEQYSEDLFSQDSYLEKSSKKIIEAFEKELKSVDPEIAEKLSIFNSQLRELRIEEVEQNNEIPF